MPSRPPSTPPASTDQRNLVARLHAGRDQAPGGFLGRPSQLGPGERLPGASRLAQRGGPLRIARDAKPNSPATEPAVAKSSFRLCIERIVCCAVAMAMTLEAQRAWNWAGRFCKKACVPSFLSSVPAQSPKSEASSDWPSAGSFPVPG